MFRNPTTDLILVLVVVLLIFGPKRLPGLGKQLGQGMREFKESITGESKDEHEGDRPELTQANSNAVPGAGPAHEPAGREAGTGTGATQGRESAEVSSEPRA
jgi:sec-independent protein translocase protein TatA